MDDKLQKTFRMLWSPEAPERAAAADALYAQSQRAGLAASDVTMVHTRELHGQLYEQRRKLQADVEALGETLAFLQARKDEEVTLGEALRWADGRKAKVDRWPRVRELARRRLFRGVWPAERQAYQQLARQLGVSPDEVYAWREGAREVPETILRSLETIEPGKKPKPAIRKVVAVGKVAFGDTELPLKEHAVLRALLDGGPRGLRAKDVEALTGIKAKTVTARFTYLKALGLAEGTGEAGYWRPTVKATTSPTEAREVA